MPRGLTTAQLAAISANSVGVAHFVVLELDSGPLRFWTGSQPATVGGNTYTAIGEFGVIDGLEDESNPAAGGVSIGLVGIPGDSVDAGIIAETRAEPYQGRPLSVSLGILDPVTGLPIDDPVPIWTGFADVLLFKLGSDITATLTGDSASALLRRTNGLRATSESHNARLGETTKDLFFEPGYRTMGASRAALK